MAGLKGLLERADGVKLAVIAACVGLCLLLLPARSGSREQTESEQLQTLLSRIEGAGEVQLMLSDEGAVAVCEGADRAQVRLDISRAVQCYTGLGADRVRIFTMKSN